MYLGTLQTELWRELCAPYSQAVFDRKKAIDFSISSFGTIGELLELFDRRGPEPQIAQQFLLRVLLAAAQQQPAEQLWKSILLYGLLPGLCAIRRRTSSSVHPPDELDAELWSSFIEVVEHYPLHRPGSVAANVLRDTSKRYRRRLRRQQKEADAFEELSEAAVMRNEEERFSFSFTRVSVTKLTAMERGEMLAVLLQCDAIALPGGGNTAVKDATTRRNARRTSHLVWHAPVTGLRGSVVPRSCRRATPGE